MVFAFAFGSATEQENANASVMADNARGIKAFGKNLEIARLNISQILDRFLEELHKRNMRGTNNYIIRTAHKKVKQNFSGYSAFFFPANHISRPTT